MIDSTLGKRPVYLIRLPGDIPPLEAAYSLALIDTSDPTQPVYQVTGRIGATP